MTSTKQWLGPFGTWPAWNCPACSKSTIRALGDTKKIVEIGLSKREHQHEAWDPDWIRNRFTQIFQCINEECGEVVTCAGQSRVEEYRSEDEDHTIVTEYYDVFTPKYFFPALKFFEIIAECPEPVAVHIGMAFASAWSDRSSAVSALRCALEEILSDRKIGKVMVNRNRKRITLNLHERIRRYGLKDGDGATLLEALKWLGNTGSHADAPAPSMDTLLEAFSIFEHAIEHIYLQKAQKIRKLAGDMIRRKGKPKTLPKKRRNLAELLG